jgi:hypothetical protein
MLAPSWLMGLALQKRQPTLCLAAGISENSKLNLILHAPTGWQQGNEPWPACLQHQQQHAAEQQARKDSSSHSAIHVRNMRAGVAALAHINKLEGLAGGKEQLRR